ncbi:MAG: SOS response-associated peptidase family protein [Planctomycetota bacterium]
MCYSAQVEQSFETYIRKYGSKIDLDAFLELFQARLGNASIKIPRGMEDAFSTAQTEKGRQIFELVKEYRQQQASRLEQDLFVLRKRKADAERKLTTKVTKGATDSLRIAAKKLAWTLEKLADLKRTVPEPGDARIYPGYYVPVMVLEGGKRVIKPMRYQCRPAGKPASYDTKYPGTYNARRDNLEGFWKGQFGHTHGLMLTHAFYEHVTLDGSEGEKKLILEFKPNALPDMLVAVLWSRWVGQDGSELLSFAAITDEPPAEIAAAGHDRCVIPIKGPNMDDWLQPSSLDLTKCYAILDDRERPYYEHRLAA